MAGAVGEHGVDHVAVLVAQLLRHVQHHTRAQVLQGNPAQQREHRSLSASTERLRGLLSDDHKHGGTKHPPPPPTRALWTAGSVRPSVHPLDFFYYE